VISITGATGNTGSAAAEALLAAGEKVRVIGRSEARLERFAEKGAEVFVGDVGDTEAMTRAFAGATAAYLVIPPSYKVESVATHQDRVIESYAAAIEGSGLRYAVALSSVGAQHEAGTGPIKGLQRMEQRLGSLPELNMLFLRAGFFMENLLQYVPVIKTMGRIFGTQDGAKPHPWIATRDIGSAAARALAARDFTGPGTRDLLGPRDYSLSEAAAIVGKAIGKDGLRYSRVPAMILKPALLAMGYSSDVVANLLEMFGAADAGLLVPLAPRSAESATPTMLETWAAEVFAPAVQGKAARA
jgi:uncharacterized protein YbjT (DUF2867 family)